MANENVQNNKSEKAGEQTANGGGADGKTYTQAELDRLFGDRAAQAKSSILKTLGFENEKDAKDALARLKSIEDGQKSELQKAQEKALALEKQVAEAAAARTALVVQNEVIAVAARLGVIDADAVYKLLDIGKLELDENGKPKNVEAALKELLKAKPYLAGGSTARSAAAGNGAGSTDSKTTTPMNDFIRRAAGRQ